MPGPEQRPNGVPTNGLSEAQTLRVKADAPIFRRAVDLYEEARKRENAPITPPYKQRMLAQLVYDEFARSKTAIGIVCDIDKEQVPTIFNNMPALIQSDIDACRGYIPVAAREHHGSKEKLAAEIQTKLSAIKSTTPERAQRLAEFLLRIRAGEKFDEIIDQLGISSGTFPNYMQDLAHIDMIETRSPHSANMLDNKVLAMLTEDPNASYETLRTALSEQNEKGKPISFSQISRSISRLVAAGKLTRKRNRISDEDRERFRQIALERNAQPGHTRVVIYELFDKHDQKHPGEKPNFTQIGQRAGVSRAIARRYYMEKNGLTHT